MPAALTARRGRGRRRGRAQSSPGVHPPRQGKSECHPDSASAPGIVSDAVRWILSSDAHSASWLVDRALVARGQAARGCSVAKVPAAEPPTGAMDVSSRNRAGQSLAEFALVVPVLMLILLIVVDFGRAYMGWVQLNNAARVGANYAGANPTASFGPGSQYATLIANDASGANCRLPTTLPGPTFPNGTALGDEARVDLTCDFTLFVGALPGFGQILPNPLRLGATAYFPIRAGTVAVGQPGCTSGTPPTAAMELSQTSGNAPLPVVLTDKSTGSPTSGLWYFGDGRESHPKVRSHIPTRRPAHTPSL